MSQANHVDPMTTEDAPESISSVDGAFLGQHTDQIGVTTPMNVRVGMQFGPVAGAHIRPLAGSGGVHVVSDDLAVVRHYDDLELQLKRMNNLNRKIVPVPKPSRSALPERSGDPAAKVLCPLCQGEEWEPECYVCDGEKVVSPKVAARFRREW